MKNPVNKKLSILILAVTVIAVLLSSCGRTDAGGKKFESLEDLENCTFAISDGNSSYEQDIASELSGVSFDRYTNYFDTFIAVANGNADAAFCFKYTFLSIKEAYPDLKYVESEFQIPIVADFSADAGELRKDFNLFIEEARQSGLLDELAEKWLYGYDELTDSDIVDFSVLKGGKKGIKFVLSNDNIPYEYLRNGKLTGYEPALFLEYCKSRGYDPDITETAYDAAVAGVSSGKYDMAMGSYGFTDERSENSHFSDPYFMDRVVYTVNGEGVSAGFFERLASGFERTFIREDRWKLFANGIIRTLLITVFSVVLGSAAGFAIFLLSRRSRFLTRLSYKINDTLEALPMLVVLMVFFYVIFGKSAISGLAVSIIVFGIGFAFSFFALLSNSVKGVSYDQTEAALALGYNELQSLFKVVFPQAMEAFIPAVRSAIIALLKGTAIVGYVAVQDLTKAGDLVRSQTFEAFIPLITVALLYFLLAKLLIFILNKLLITPAERRKKIKEGK